MHLIPCLFARLEAVPDAPQLQEVYIWNVYNITIYTPAIAGATKANYTPQLLYNYKKRDFGLLL